MWNNKASSSIGYRQPQKGREEQPEIWVQAHPLSLSLGLLRGYWFSWCLGNEARGERDDEEPALTSFV